MKASTYRHIASVVALAGLGVLAVGTGDSTTSSNKAQESVQPISSINWHTIDSIYNLKHKATDIQKDEAWKQLKGKRVQWTGRVSEISDSFGSLTLQIKMNPDTFTSDIILTLRKDQRDKAVKLSKGEPVTFTGTLDRWGSLMPISMKDGEIE